MKQLNQWMHEHPYKAVGFAVLFTVVATFVGCNDHLWNAGLAAWGLLVAAWSFIYLRDTRKLAAILATVMAITSMPVKAAEREPVNGGGVVIGIVVVCSAGVCVYKMVKFCQKKFPKEKAANTNATPEALTWFSSDGGTGSGGGRSAGAKNFGDLGSCGAEEQSELYNSEGVMMPATLFTIDVRMDAQGRVTTQTGATFGTNDIQGWVDFQAEVATHGVQVTGVPGHTSYATNGVPCASEDVPIMFDDVTHSVSIRGTGPSRRCEVERSTDMVAWAPFISVTVSREAGAQIVDASASGAMFYRVRLSEAGY